MLCINFAQLANIAQGVTINTEKLSYNPQDLYPYIHHLRRLIEPIPTHPRWLITWYGYGYLLHTAPPVHHGTPSAS